jgi:hypothetical protein
MASNFDVREWVDNVYKVGTAVRIAILPPWKIEDVKGHPAVNLGALVVTAISYLVLRQFTPEGDFGITEIGVLTLFVVIFLFGCGIGVNFFDPKADAVKLSNRWSTFMVVSFLYAILFQIAFSFLIPLVTGLNPYDVLSTWLGDSDRASWAVSTLLATVASFAALYWRTHRWFSQYLTNDLGFLFLAMISCFSVNWGILFVLLFVI